MVPILWSYPYKHVYKKESLFNIIISHLSDNSIKFLKDKNIIEANFQKQKLSFKYIKFCRYLNDIHKIFPIRSSNLLKEKIYKLFISECSSIKSLSSEMVCYPILKYPGANISLSNLYELDFKSGRLNDYHELAQICRSIEKIYIDLSRPNITELIEMQKQIKYIYVKEDDNCEKIDQALEKHANSIVLLNLTIYTKNGSFLYDLLLPKLSNLQYLRINNMESKCILKHVIHLNYYNLQVLDLVEVSLDIAINIIQNTNGNLWKIKIRCHADYDRIKEYDQTIHQYCPNIKYVTVFLNDETLKELEKIFIKCQHLVAIDVLENFSSSEYANKLLNLLVDLAPLTLYRLHIDFITNFNREYLKLFFTNWNRKGRKTLHLYHLCDYLRERLVVKNIRELEYYNDDFWNHRITMLNDEKND
ncbi:unnamed protein product [Rhizophagus irregularis]|nr:unnamed protein product [Rhizophagus irregularis]